MLALTMILGMAACSGTPTQSSAAASAAESQKAQSQESTAAGPVTLKFGAQADSTPATQAAIDAFNASQTKYKVEWQQFTNDSAQMHVIPLYVMLTLLNNNRTFLLLCQSNLTIGA